MSQPYVAGKTSLKSFSLLLSVTLATLAGQLAVAGGKRENAQQLPANIDLPQEIFIPQELPMNNSAGTLPKDPYGGLYTMGNQIVDQDGVYCRMTGLNFSGFETRIAVPHGTWARDYGDMIDQIASMGFNTIRVPFCIDNMLSTSGAAPDYINGQWGELNDSGDRANADLVVSWNATLGEKPDMKTPLLCLDAFILRAKSNNLKIILDCHSQNIDDYTFEPLWYKSTKPEYSYDNEQRWLDMWEFLADRYSAEIYDGTVIACDLFNEPKEKPTGNATGCAWLAVSDYVSATTPGEAWNYAAQRCAEVIHCVAPGMLIMVEGTQWASTSATRSFSGSDYTHWGSNLKGAQTILVGTGTDYANKVIYSIHDYPESTSYICYYNSDATKTGHPENPLPWFPRSCNYNPPSGKSYPYNLSAQAWEPFWGFLVENDTAPIHVGELGSWLSGTGYTPVTPNSTSYTDDLQYWIVDSLAIGCTKGTNTSVTPAELIASDKQWLDALLHYMDGDWNLSTPIDGLKDTEAVTRDDGSVDKKGMSFTWFTYNADSSDTGGMVLDDFKTINTEKLAFLTPYLAPLISTKYVEPTCGGTQSARVLQSPRSSLLIAGNPLAKSTLLGGKVEFALSRLPMAGTFAWKNPSTVPTEGTSTHFVRFTPANSAFRSVLLPLQVRTVVPTIEDADSKGDSASTFGPFYGVNLCGAEYSPSHVPGTNSIDYAFPTGAQTSYYVDKGMNIIRLPFLWERLQPQMNEPFDSSYQTLLVNSVAALRAAGATVLIDVHNYNRRKTEAGDTGSTAGIGALAPGATTSSVPMASFADLWTRLANLFKNDQGVVFGLMNEPTGAWDSYGHAMTSAQWVLNANAAIIAIRETGAQNWITCPGNFYTGAWSWTTSRDPTVSPSDPNSTNAVTMLNVKDSLYKTVIEVHQYFDDNYYQGKSQDCVTSDGEDLLSDVTSWARTNSKKLFLGEFGSGNNPTCESAVAGSTQGVLQYMQSNSDVWTGWAWWSSVADNTANDQSAFNATDFSLAPVNGNDSPYMGWMAPYLSAAFTADLDRNGYVNTADLSNMLLNFGECTAPGCGDLNQDGQVDYTDVGLMLLEFHD
jgi:endoglucanase